LLYFLIRLLFHLSLLVSFESLFDELHLVLSDTILAVSHTDVSICCLKVLNWHLNAVFFLDFTEVHFACFRCSAQTHAILILILFILGIAHVWLVVELVKELALIKLLKRSTDVSVPEIVFLAV
jgi:hypothetical protein